MANAWQNFVVFLFFVVVANHFSSQKPDPINQPVIQIADTLHVIVTENRQYDTNMNGCSAGPSAYGWIWKSKEKTPLALSHIFPEAIYIRHYGLLGNQVDTSITYNGPGFCIVTSRLSSTVWLTRFEAFR